MATSSNCPKDGECHDRRRHFRRGQRTARRRLLQMISIFFSFLFLFHILSLVDEIRANSAKVDQSNVLIKNLHSSVETVHAQCELDVAFLCAPSSPFHLISSKSSTKKMNLHNKPEVISSSSPFDTIFNEIFSPHLGFGDEFFEDPFKFFDKSVSFFDLEQESNTVSPNYEEPCAHAPKFTQNVGENINAASSETDANKPVEDQSQESNSILPELIVDEEHSPLTVENKLSSESPQDVSPPKNQSWASSALSVMRRALKSVDEEVPRRRLQASSPLIFLLTDTFPSDHEIYPTVSSSISSVPLHYGRDVDECIKHNFNRITNQCQKAVIRASEVYSDFQNYELDMKRNEAVNIFHNDIYILALLLIGSFVLFLKFNRFGLRKKGKKLFTRRVILHAVYNDPSLKAAVSRATGLKLDEVVPCGPIRTKESEVSEIIHGNVHCVEAKQEDS
mmetsp:Transcript_27952/g.56041  ORF Transcript_27952/g.56041 Transcript_27952/m.56041 type:complete len:449 (+) Transcript_27952:56-1402(+)